MNAPASLTPRARASLDRMMMLGLRQSLAADRPDADIRLSPESTRQGCTQMVMLSIASYGFRIVTALQFDESPATRAHMAGLRRQTGQDMGHQEFIDALCESGNMCCGAINRELGAFYDHLGLSTPQILDVRSLPHLEELGAQHLSHFRIDLGDGLQLHANLCAQAYEPMDFDWQMPEQPEATGLLEMF
jgi:hypothetical protein